jgi:hypothetical protein
VFWREEGEDEATGWSSYCRLPERGAGYYYSMVIERLEEQRRRPHSTVHTAWWSEGAFKAEPQAVFRS